MDANSMLEFYMASYQNLLEAARLFPKNLSSIAPEYILKESQKLELQQKELRKHDALMLQTLKESDTDAIDWDKLKECQEVIQQVVNIFDTISIKAHTQKAMLAEELKNVSKGLGGLKGYSNINQESGTLLKRSF